MASMHRAWDWVAGSRGRGVAGSRGRGVAGSRGRGEGITMSRA